jgi:hypothetical protein
MQEASGVATTDHYRSARLPSFFDLVTDLFPAYFHRSSFPFPIQSQVIRAFGAITPARCASRRCENRGPSATPPQQWVRRGIAVDQI